MMRSLFAGVQGLRAHQVRMDVIGNNIANVNTTGFKASRVMFAEMYNQTIGGAMAPGLGRGGINPMQVGLGVGVAAIDVDMSEGSLQLTGKTTDLAISGNGMFVLRDGSGYVYTRAGHFDFDSEGYLVNPATGMRVQGWMPDATDTFPSREAANLQDIRLPVADTRLATATNEVIFDQSLNAGVAVGTVHTTAATVIDSLGREHTVNLTLTKVADNAWDIAADIDGTPLTLANPYPAGITIAPAPGANLGRIQFNTDGSLMDNDANPTTPFQISFTAVPGTGAGQVPSLVGANTLNVALDFTKVIQPALDNTVLSTMRMLSYNGRPTGTLTDISIDAQGVVTGYYSNGEYRQVAQVALAHFYNPAGLTKVGNNAWAESPNSGFALIGQAGESGRGYIASNNLEMSNVDISQEFTNMIVTQRGFQANSRIITTTDEMLQEVVNIKR